MSDTLYEHEDGRYAVAPGTESPAFTHGDPKWHRVGPVDVSALHAGAAAAEPGQIYRHNPENGQVWSETDVRFHCKDTSRWTRVVIPAAALTSAPAVPEAGLPLAQEPKYTVNGTHIVNRASGEVVPHDEPVFIFRARDIHAINILAQYAREVSVAEHREAVWARVTDFKAFWDAHPTRMKTPDTTQLKGVQPGERGEG